MSSLRISGVKPESIKTRDKAEALNETKRQCVFCGRHILDQTTAAPPIDVCQRCGDALVRLFSNRLKRIANIDGFEEANRG